MTGTQTWQNGNKGLKLGNYSPFAHVLCDTNMMSIPVCRMWNLSFSRLLILLLRLLRRRTRGNLNKTDAQESIYCLFSESILFFKVLFSFTFLWFFIRECVVRLTAFLKFWWQPQYHLSAAQEAGGRTLLPYSLADCSGEVWAEPSVFSGFNSPLWTFL